MQGMIKTLSDLQRTLDNTQCVADRESGAAQTSLSDLKEKATELRKARSELDEAQIRSRRKTEALGKQILVRLLKMSLMRAFQTWNDHAKQKKRKRSILARVVNYWTHQIVSTAMEAWRYLTKQQRRIKNNCRNIIFCVLNHLCTVTFCT